MDIASDHTKPKGAAPSGLRGWYLIIEDIPDMLQLLARTCMAMALKMCITMYTKRGGTHPSSASARCLACSRCSSLRAQHALDLVH